MCHYVSEVRWGGREELTPRMRSGAAAGRSNLRTEARGGVGRTIPTSKEWWLLRHRRAERSYTTYKVRRGDLSKVRSSGCTLLEQP